MCGFDTEMKHHTYSYAVADYDIIGSKVRDFIYKTLYVGSCITGELLVVKYQYIHEDSLN